MMPDKNFPSGDLAGLDHQFPAGTKPAACQSLCDNTTTCHAWTFLQRGPAGQMACCIKGPIARDGCPVDAKGMFSGAKTAGSVQCNLPPPPPPPPPPPGPPYHHTGPLTCQDNAKFPMLPTFHIIGNVTQSTDGTIKLEPINDASGVTCALAFLERYPWFPPDAPFSRYYNGIYHVWHQCCQVRLPIPVLTHPRPPPPPHCSCAS